MKSNKGRKGFVFGIIALLIFLAITPPVQSDPVYIDVFECRWDGVTDDYVCENVSILLSTYVDFLDDFADAGTYQEDFEVLQDYGIIPANKTYGDWVDFCDDLWSEYEDMLEENITEYKEEMEDERPSLILALEGTRVKLTDTEINFPIVNWYCEIPFVYYICWTNWGADVTYECRGRQISGPSFAHRVTENHYDSFFGLAFGEFEPTLTKPITWSNVVYNGIMAYAIIWIEIDD